MASKIFLPLRLAKWGDFDLFTLPIPNTDFKAESIIIKGSKGATVFAIEDGDVQQNGQAALLISSEDEKPDDGFVGRQWTYGNVQVTKTGPVKAGDKIGKVFDNKNLRLTIQTDDDIVNIGTDANPNNIELPQNPLPALESLKVVALPQDAKEVDESSDEPGELADIKRKAKGPSALKTVAIFGGLGIGTYFLYKVIK